MEHLVNLVHIDLPEQHISSEAAHAFSDRLRQQEIRCQLFLAHKKTLTKALNVAFELEAPNAAAGTSLRVWQTMLRNFMKNQSLTMDQIKERWRSGQRLARSQGKLKLILTWKQEQEASQEGVEALTEHQEVPNKEAAVETIRAQEDRYGDQQLALVY